MSISGTAVAYRERGDAMCCVKFLMTYLICRLEIRNTKIV